MRTLLRIPFKLPVVRFFALFIVKCFPGITNRIRIYFFPEVFTSLPNPLPHGGEGTGYRSLEGNIHRIFIDVSEVVRTNFGTGVQRVVMNIVRELSAQSKHGMEVIPVEIKRKRFSLPEKWIRENIISINTTDKIVFNETKNNNNNNNIIKNIPKNIKIEYQQNDIILMLDSSWGLFCNNQFDEELLKAKKQNASIVFVLYDLIPIQHPEYYPSQFSKGYEHWLQKAIHWADAFICISKSVADELIHYIEKIENHKSHQSRSRSLKIGYWHLGSDPFIQNIPKSRPDTLFSTTANPINITFLMVGTIEPRKKQDFVLDAFEILWEKGSQINLCIAGKKGWMMEDLINRIEHHPENNKRYPEKNKRLIWIENPTDASLANHYQSASGLIFASMAEGFGLPIIEAAQFGIPILARDIPVFREIGGDCISYFSSNNVQEFSIKLEQWINTLDKKTETKIPDSSKMKTLTWKESSAKLIEIFKDKVWYKELKIN